MRIFKLIIVLIIFMGLSALIEERVPFIRETFTAFILFLSIKITVLVLVIKLLFLKRNLSVK